MSFAGLDMKVFAYMMSCFFIALFATDSLWQLLLIIGFGAWSGFKLQDLKDARLKGMLRHISYYFGLTDTQKKFKRIPKSYIKEFVG